MQVLFYVATATFAKKKVNHPTTNRFLFLPCFPLSYFFFLSLLVSICLCICPAPFLCQRPPVFSPLTKAAASGSKGPFARFRRPQLFDPRPQPHVDPAVEGSGRDRSSSHTDNAFLRLKNASRVAALPAAGVTSGKDKSTCKEGIVARREAVSCFGVRWG